MTAGVCAAQADRPPLQRRTLSRLVHRLQMGVHVGYVSEHGCEKQGRRQGVTGAQGWTERAVVGSGSGREGTDGGPGAEGGAVRRSRGRRGGP